MNRTRKAGWSFMLLRGADKTVRQFHVSKRSVVAAPAVAVLAVSGCIGGLQLKSAFKISHLEDQLSQQTSQFAQTVSAKDEAILNLQKEITLLSQQTKNMETKLNDLQALENKLQQFIEKYGAVTGSSHSSRNSDSSVSRGKVQSLSASIGGKTSSVIPLANSSQPSAELKRMAALADSSTLDLQAVSDMLDEMEQTMAYSLKQYRLRQAELDAIPSGWPTSSHQMTSGFGYRKDPFTGKATFHAGIDIAGNTGDPVFSAANGIVEESGFSSSEGNHIVIDHGNGLRSVYMHLKQIEAREGDTIVRGEKIGLLGSTGRSSGPHLHFQVMQRDEAVNPLNYLSLVKED
ncbi:M23 family metallopeptidase [Paenibacillus gorillae]|uniref:M23 family metallopeptidase n=1 Tax=Paenibacillus gorillae TaxID=1243662 RepID=UPI00069480DB|nr:M23 family metallopeptidase [Paenibacillus gorillae]